MSAIRPIATALLFGLMLVGCEEESDSASSNSDGAFPDILAPLRAECEKSGGRWGAVPGRGTFVCYKTTRDANKFCQTESDCEGLCLARSRTCAPVTPFFGCHEVFSSTGLRQTRCVN